MYSFILALSVVAGVAANPQLSFSSRSAPPAPAQSSSSSYAAASSSSSSSSVYVAPSSSSSSSVYVAPSSTSSAYVAPSSSSSSSAYNYAPSYSSADSSAYSYNYAPSSSAYSDPAPSPSSAPWSYSDAATSTGNYYDFLDPVSSAGGPSYSSAAAPPTGSQTPAELEADAAEKVKAARLVPTVAERIAILENKEYEFDFVSATTGLATGTAGHSVTASSLNYPALVGTGMSMTVGFLGPCGLNTPHTHPRGTELNYVVNGTLRTGFLMENGARFVFNDAHAGTVSVFPAGAIHFEQNNGCEPVMFVAHFNHEDAGVTALAQRFFGLPPDIVGATLGGLTPEEIAEIETKIPNNIALGADECLKRCGITRPPLQLTSQQQGRNPGNALPAGFSSVKEADDLYPATGIRFPESSAAGYNPPAPSSVAAPASSSVPYYTSSSYDAYSYYSNSDSAYPSSSDTAAYPSSSKAPGLNAALGETTDANGNPTNQFAATPLLIALVAVNGAFVIAALAAMFVCLRRRSQGDRRGKYVQPSQFKPSMVEHQEYEDVPYSGTR